MSKLVLIYVLYVIGVHFHQFQRQYSILLASHITIVMSLLLKNKKQTGFEQFNN